MGGPSASALPSRPGCWPLIGQGPAFLASDWSPAALSPSLVTTLHTPGSVFRWRRARHIWSLSLTWGLTLRCPDWGTGRGQWRPDMVSDNVGHISVNQGPGLKGWAKGDRRERRVAAGGKCVENLCRGLFPLEKCTAGGESGGGVSLEVSNC